MKEVNISAFDEFKLTVDYSRTLQKMIKAGNYDWLNEDVTEKHFPIPSKLSNKNNTILVKLFYFKNPISFESAINKLDKVDCRPAMLTELLALGEAMPELQKHFPIVALGSVWHNTGDCAYVPILSFSTSWRKLNLAWLGSGWGNYCVIMAVAK